METKGISQAGNAADAFKRVGAAHKAVMEGIATHAQKKAVEREAALTAMETQERINQALGIESA